MRLLVCVAGSLVKLHSAVSFEAIGPAPSPPAFRGHKEPLAWNGRSITRRGARREAAKQAARRKEHVFRDKLKLRFCRSGFVLYYQQRLIPPG